MILPTYVEGAITPEQLSNLRNIEVYAPLWFWWKRGDKQPQSPKGGPGKVNVTTTAGTLVQALRAMKKNSGGGVGPLVSSGVQGLIGIDLDSVIQGDDIHPLGQEAIKQFAAAYVEVSPSGTGLRIFCEGVKPDSAPDGPTAMGKEHHGQQIKFEVYAAGGEGRYLRATGLPLQSTVGAVVPCQAGVDWFCDEIQKARARSRAATPSPNKVNAMGLDAVFSELAELRTELPDAETLSKEMQRAVAARSRSKLAAAWRGDLKAFNGDHSTADASLCCELVRRGAGHLQDVVAVWAESGLGQREKFNREDYQLRTVDRAARDVLLELQSKATKDIKGVASVELPGDVLAALDLTGDKVTCTKAGRLEATEGNVVMLLRNDPRVKGLLGFNELVQAAFRLGPWTVFDRGGCAEPGRLTDDDVTRASMWLAVEYGMKMDSRCLMRGIEAAARDARFNPLADRLRQLGKVWDGVSRVDKWLTEYALIDDTNCVEYVSRAGRCFLVGAVARAMSPGCQFDTVLSVEGAGGGGKSSMFKVLAGAVASDLFADGVHDVSNSIALVEGTSGRWIVELPELAGIRRAADVEALKAAITRTEDTHRRPYDVMERAIPRKFAFVATTNRTEGYLADTSGALARRFHPVRTLATESNPIDRARLATDAPQIWAEAFCMYSAGVVWHISEADAPAYSQWLASRETRREDGAFQDELVEYLQAWVCLEPSEGRSLKRIAEGVGDKRTAESGGTGAAAMQLAGTLALLGMEKRKSGTARWFFSTTTANKFKSMAENAQREQSGQCQKKSLRAA